MKKDLMKRRNLTENEAVAVIVARDAGNFLHEPREKSRFIRIEEDKDIKLQADVDAENFIREILTQETGLLIIGEEMGGERNLLKSNERYWVVDPLDGTYNYFRKQSDACVSIGLMEGKQFLFGVIYNFNMGELVFGGKGKGIILCDVQGNTLHENVVQPSWAETIEKACLMTGFPVRSDYDQEGLMRYVQKLMEFKKVRMIGSAAWALASVALGKADAYCERKTCLWDVAAGIALVEGAGGHVKVDWTEEDELVLDVMAVGRKEWIKALEN